MESFMEWEIGIAKTGRHKVNVVAVASYLAATIDSSIE